MQFQLIFNNISKNIYKNSNENAMPLINVKEIENLQFIIQEQKLKIEELERKCEEKEKIIEEQERKIKTYEEHFASKQKKQEI